MQILKIFGRKSVATTFSHIPLFPQQTRGRASGQPSSEASAHFFPQLFKYSKTNSLLFFRSIALWAIPYHPCSSSPPSTAANTRATAALTNVNVHVEVHMCVKICANICVQISANFCIIRVQILAHFCIVYLQPYMCISTELLQMRLHLYVTSYLTKCDGSLPPLLQIWGPNCPSTSGSSA